MPNHNASGNNSESSAHPTKTGSVSKRSKARSKISKAAAAAAATAAATASSQHKSQQEQTPLNIAQEAMTPTAMQDLPKEKAYHRNYPGFEPKSIKTIWEQHDANDTDITSEVYSRLAEDVTYRVWELAKTIKTYARHSGGKVTVDLVNEVLKDSDVPPVLGAGDTEWDRIDYDGSFFFNSDHILELRNEYLSNVEPSVVCRPEVTQSWSVDKQQSKILLELMSNMTNAIFLGNQDSFNYAIKIAAFSRQIGCILKLILRKCSEILAFEQKFGITKRCLKFLNSLSYNYHIRGIEHREELYHLSEILTCLLVGKLSDIKIKKSYKKETLQEQSSEDFNSTKQLNNQIIKQEQIKEDLILPRPIKEQKHDEECFNHQPIKEESIYIKEEEGIEQQQQVKEIVTQQKSVDNEAKEIKKEIDDNIEIQDVQNKNEKLVEMIERDDFQAESEAKVQLVEDHQYHEQIQYSPYVTEICDFEHVDLITSTLGHLSTQFGYLQSEMTFLIRKRLEKFFQIHQNLHSNEDYEFLSRCARGLIALGEHAFREMLVFLPKIDPYTAPEWIRNDFSPAAIFLKGKDDIYLYEWLEILCGDKLHPFMNYSYNYYQKLTSKLYKNLRKPTYKILPKLNLKRIDKTTKIASSNKQVYFPDVQSCNSIQESKEINFKFSSPGYLTKTLKKKSSISNDSIKTTSRALINDKIVIAKRKNFKILTNEKKFIKLSNFCYLQI